eukprot:Hpha_TRINITY_DN2082_c0_g1::TRINITY_DN2082_c0_g1_i1::g.82987::m.82987
MRVAAFRSASARARWARWASFKAPPMVFVKGEEMTRYAMQEILDKWVDPHVDTSAWEYYDLSCASRDETEDQVLKDVVSAGKRLGAIFKEPTITPSAIQVKQMGLKKAWGSPNGAMRKGWNGITISRDTIHLPGVELGYKRPVFFERHAVGGEYGAGWQSVGAGKLVTQFFPSSGGSDALLTRRDFTIVDERNLSDKDNVAVVYHNPLDNVGDLATHFFGRCLEAKIVPYVVTKKTVFKWQEGFWQIMKEVFDRDWKEKYLAAGLLDTCGGELQHLISDAATMQIIRWTDGGFGMAAHNYDGDMLTDEISQVHRSPGFITSNLIGKSDDGSLIKEFEASHGTVADMWEAHKRGEEHSFNPLGMVEALIGAMNHSAHLALKNAPSESVDELNAAKAKAAADEKFEEAGAIKDKITAAEQAKSAADIYTYTAKMQRAVHNTFRYGQGTRDLCGASGLTTQDFIAKVGWRLDRYLAGESDEPKDTFKPTATDPRYTSNVDKDKIKQMFDNYDTDGNGQIDLDEFEAMMIKLGVAPMIKSANKEADE